MISSYIEPRWNKQGRNRVLFFGLQAYLKGIPLITREDVDHAEKRILAHGEPFNREHWDIIVNEYNGRLPVLIEALPEGTVHRLGVPQVQVCNTDPRFPWLVSYLETAMIRAVWYPTTVATVSWEIKQDLRGWLNMTSDDPEGQLLFRLHDFGGRGASSSESAMIGGMGHLVNFMGTDTMEALEGAFEFYNEPMAGFSIPAAEHSTITTWGEDRECEAFENMIDQFGGPGKIFAVVSDSYDFKRAVTDYWGTKLKDKVLSNGGTLVVRPDSGDPVEIVLWTVRELDRIFGSTTNSKGYKVLNSAVRVIQGDGVNPGSIHDICVALEANGYSIENVAFGMGGALLQKVDRDTFGYAMKANGIVFDSIGNGLFNWTDVSKNPKTDSSKKSKAGRQAVVVGEDGEYTAIRAVQLNGRENMMRTVFLDGKILVDQTFSEIRARSNM